MTCEDEEEQGLMPPVPKGRGFTDYLPRMPIEQIVQIFQDKLSKEEVKELNQLFQYEISSKELRKILDGFQNTLESERKALLEMCGYTVLRYSEVKDAMYLKALFVVRNYDSLKGEYSVSKFRSVLSILLSDTSVLFTDADENFFYNRINEKALSEWNPLFYDTKRRRDYRNLQATNCSKQFREKDRHLCAAMLDKISKSAVKNHQNIQSWVKNHLPYDDSDIDKNLRQLKEAFPGYANQITLNFSENFYLLALPGYAGKIAMLSNDELHPSRPSVFVDQEAAQLFVYYKARLRRFENLRGKACEQEKSLKPIRAFSE